MYIYCEIGAFFCRKVFLGKVHWLFRSSFRLLDTIHMKPFLSIKVQVNGSFFLLTYYLQLRPTFFRISYILRFLKNLLEAFLFLIYFDVYLLHYIVLHSTYFNEVTNNWTVDCIISRIQLLYKHRNSRRNSKRILADFISKSQTRNVENHNSALYYIYLCLFSTSSLGILLMIAEFFKNSNKNSD